MTEYQKLALNELIDVLSFDDFSEKSDLERCLSLAKTIRDFICDPESVEEDKSESNIMDAYFQGKRLELFQSIDGIPFVCPGDDVYACAGMTLDRFVELLGMRQAREEEGKS